MWKFSTCFLRDPVTDLDGLTWKLSQTVQYECESYVMERLDRPSSISKCSVWLLQPWDLCRWKLESTNKTQWAVWHAYEILATLSVALLWPRFCSWLYLLPQPAPFAWPFVGAVKIDQKLVCQTTENAVPQCDTKPVFLQTTCITGVKALILAEVALRSGHSVVRCVALTPLWLRLFSASAYRETSMEFLSKPVLRRFLSVRVDFH